MNIARSHTTPQFEKDFLALSINMKRKAERRVKLFEDDCFSSALDTHKLKGRLSDFLSFSVDDDYRVIFRFLPHQEAIYYRIGPHKIYREFERSL